MSIQSSNDPHALALAALTATLKDERRAQRFLELTGIGTAELRSGLGDPWLLAATLSFLEAHEPDLVAVADKIGVTPGDLVRARQELDG